MRPESQLSFRVSISATLRQEGIQCAFRPPGQHAPGHLLGAIYDFIDGPYPQLATIQLHNDISASLQTDRLPELRRDAETTSF